MVDDRLAQHTHLGPPAPGPLLRSPPALTTVAPLMAAVADVGGAVRRVPSPTRGRYLLLIVVLLLGGASAGVLTHHLLLGQRWKVETQACLARAAAAVPDDPILRTRLIEVCRAPIEHRPFLFAVAGAGLMLAVAVLLSLLLPELLLRRLGGRRPAPEALSVRGGRGPAGPAPGRCGTRHGPGRGRCRVRGPPAGADERGRRRLRGRAALAALAALGVALAADDFLATAR